MNSSANRSPLRVLLRKLLLFCGCSVFLEISLQLCLFRTVSVHTIYPVLFGLITGLLCTLTAAFLPRIPQRILAIALVLLQCLLAEVQLIYHAVFGNLMPIQQVAMGGGVLTGFLNQILYTIGKHIWEVLLLLLPLAAVIVTICRGKLRERLPVRQLWVVLGALAVLIAGSVTLMRFACAHPRSAWQIFRNPDITTDVSYRNLGMTVTTVQELRCLLLGEPAEDKRLDDPGSDRSAETYDPEVWNVIPDLDFNALAQTAEIPAQAALDRYFAAREPTRKNEYTGRLAGYNVIVLCAESYSPWFVTEELTPTLYKMSRTGLVFDNYYGTFNSMTTNGEYGLCLSLLPDMTRGKTQSSFDASVGHYLPFCLGTALKEYGYSTWAYHNNNGEFYNRSRTHTNMGYYFQAQGSGLELTPAKPASDLEMIEASVDDYVNSDKPFHVYYMTYSGHYQYSWENDMSAKHRAEVDQLPYSEEVKAYIACNLEVELALSCLEQKLEEAGKLDNTLIVLTNDHYPYGLSEQQYNELAGRRIDVDFEKYRNHWICWAPGMGETVHVDAYCSTTDILPTLLNLLGVKYDSRLLAGRDVLSDCKHMAVLQDGSILTDSFRYQESTGELIVTEPSGQVDEALVAELRKEAADRFAFSREILDTDYYAHVFPGNSIPVQEELPFDDVDGMSVRTQGNILFIYRKGLIDLYAEHTFGWRYPATVGDYVTAVYRYLEEPETTEDALPQDWLDGDPERLAAFRESPQFNAVCWAFAEGLLRADDRLRAYDDPMDNLVICLLLRRTSELLELREVSVEPSAVEEFRTAYPEVTQEEAESAVWAQSEEIIRGDNHTQGKIWEKTEANAVTRYRLVLFLLKLLYPNITI